ncbi:MAG: helix-turn-helix domain-containing protein [Clostridiales bacterium]|nr:helix-turn-helix domain-containing protein [Clostridiales bacterium]
MQALGTKIAAKRKDLGMTQIEFAEKLSVTRQTVSRWEAGTVMPDIDKIGDIAELLGVSCDYLLKDDLQDEQGAAAPKSGISRLLEESLGRPVKLSFFDEEADIDLYNTVCTITDFEGSWMKVSAKTKKGEVEKLIPVSSIQSLEYAEEDA